MFILIDHKTLVVYSFLPALVWIFSTDGFPVTKPSFSRVMNVRFSSISDLSLQDIRPSNIVHFSNSLLRLCACVCMCMCTHMYTGQINPVFLGSWLQYWFVSSWSFRATSWSLFLKIEKPKNKGFIVTFPLNTFSFPFRVAWKKGFEENLEITKFLNRIPWHWWSTDTCQA